MYIYLPDGFILFPKIGGEGAVESIVTSINGYFLVPVSENGCVHCFFFYISLVFLVCLVVVVVVGFFCLFVFLSVKHRMV